jgi:hypothetical protein
MPSNPYHQFLASFKHAPPAVKSFYKGLTHDLKTRWRDRWIMTTAFHDEVDWVQFKHDFVAALPENDRPQ